MVSTDSKLFHRAVRSLGDVSIAQTASHDPLLKEHCGACRLIESIARRLGKDKHGYRYIMPCSSEEYTRLFG